MGIVLRAVVPLWHFLNNSPQGLFLSVCPCPVRVWDGTPRLLLAALGVCNNSCPSLPISASMSRCFKGLFCLDLLVFACNFDFFLFCHLFFFQVLCLTAGQYTSKLCCSLTPCVSSPRKSNLGRRIRPARYCNEAGN